MSVLGLTGVFSGIDSDILIARAMSYSRRPLARLQLQKAAWRAKDAALVDLESRLATFKSQVDSLRSAATLENTRAVALDTDILTASASTGATEGTYQMEINQLAQSHRLVRNIGLAETTSTVGAAKSTALNLNGMADADATWFTTSGNGATYTFDFGDENDITSVVFATSTSYSINQVAALINVRSQAVSGYNAASVEADAQTGKSYLRLTAQSDSTAGTMTQTLTAGDAIAEINDAADWTKTAADGGTFVYTYDSTTRTITVTSETTLENLRDLINNDAQNPGVTASILEYNSTYHLVLGGKDTGIGYAITIDDLATTIEGFDTPDFVDTQTAQNIELRVDGYPAGAEDWIERSSNTITDVIPNVTITARTTGTTTISISRDTSLLRSDLSNLAAVYNGLVDKIGQYTGYDADTKVGGVLQGDTGITRLLDSLRSGITSSVPGFLSGTDAFTLTSEIGLEFGQSDEDDLPVFEDIGKLFFDDTILDTALTSDYRGVLGLIGGWGTGVSDSSDIQFTSAHKTTEGGAYNVRVDFDAGGAIALAMIKKEGESVWRNLDISDNELTGKEGNAEQYLKLAAVWDGAGAYTEYADVRVRQGFAHVLHNRVSDLLDDVTGVIAAKRDRSESAIETINRNIEVQERLLASKQKYLERKYVRMETALARLDYQRGAFEALFAALDARNNND